MTRSSSILVLLLTAALGGTAAAKPKVAIVPLWIDSDRGIAQKPEAQALASELTLALQLRAQSADSPYELTTRSTATAASLAHCKTELPACMAPIGAGIGVSFLIYGAVKQEGTRYVARLTLLNVNTKQRVRSLGNFELADDAARPIEAGPIASKLSKQLYPKLWFGKAVSTIVVTAGSMQASITVDGKPVADLVNGAVRLPHYAKGEYVVAITTRGHTTKQTVTIGDDGEDVIVNFKLALPRMGIDG